MKLLIFIQRILAALIDLIVVYIPVYFMVAVMVKGFFTPGILSAALFVIYNVLAIHSFQGQTIGKYFAKIEVKDVGRSIMDDSIREAVKILYFLPFVGFVTGLLSLGCYLISGRFLHDVIGKSEVVVHG
ncbi:RDD family protein [Enterococcus sp. DIV0242_7C1]|nr:MULTISPECIES: RDD family protein [unclassified Enterococcus]MBO0470141.1 RDD family protein [Enterococcus sp. DIV0242_7C1]MCA5013700.1 RDD family protein [Enterococcus sp. S23]MCA5016950.1 RDD family protein [Enterococcus sp. S22(2020)]